MIYRQYQEVVGEAARNSDTLQRMILLAFASIVLELPQTMLGIFGYGSTEVILLETTIVLAGFFISLHATSSKNMLRRIKPESLLAVVISLIVLPELFELLIVQQVNIVTIILESTGAAGIVAASMLWFRTKLSGRRPVFYLIIISSFITATIGTATWLGSSSYPTDEVLINMFSAHLFLLGKNPYLASNTANAFSYYGFSSGFTLSFATPKLTGGFVSTLSYPALSFLYFLPAVIFNINGPLWTMPAYILPAAAIALSYRRTRLLGFIAILFLLLDPQYFYQIRMGYIDVLWVGFSMLSIYSYKRPWLSGILFGIALAVKQDPVFLAPFLVVFIWKEQSGAKALRWVAAAAFAFLIINAYFIALGPSLFISSLIGPESSGLLGIGFGPSQLSFLGYFPMSPTFYTLLEMSVFLILFGLYAFKYNRLRYAFIAFPILIYLFNYRLLLEYIMFWPLIGLIIPPFFVGDDKETGTGSPIALVRYHRSALRNLVVVLLCLAVATVPAGYAIHEQKEIPIFHLSNPVIYENSTGAVYRISVDILLSSSSGQASPVLFRIVHEGPINDSNGFLWQPLPDSVRVGSNPVNVNLSPLQASQEFTLNGTYILIAYYGDAIGNIQLKAGSVTVI